MLSSLLQTFPLNNFFQKQQLAILFLRSARHMAVNPQSNRSKQWLYWKRISTSTGFPSFLYSLFPYAEIRTQEASMPCSTI